LTGYKLKKILQAIRKRSVLSLINKKPDLGTSFLKNNKIQLK
jgi:hypothetical protein